MICFALIWFRFYCLLFVVYHICLVNKDSHNACTEQKGYVDTPCLPDGSCLGIATVCLSETYRCRCDDHYYSNGTACCMYNSSFSIDVFTTITYINELWFQMCEIWTSPVMQWVTWWHLGNLMFWRFKIKLYNHFFRNLWYLHGVLTVIRIYCLVYLFTNRDCERNVSDRICL